MTTRQRTKGITLPSNDIGSVVLCWTLASGTEVPPRFGQYTASPYVMVPPGLPIPGLHCCANVSAKLLL